MELKVKTAEGDMLDEICARYYPDNPDAIDQVLDANPGLSQYPPILPANIDIALPTLDNPTKQTVNIWD